MLAPELSTRTDTENRHVTVSVSGPVATADHAAALTIVCQEVPQGFGLVVNLSNVTILTETGVRGLRRLAGVLTAAGTSIAFVCSELILRAELLLADLDLVAPVLQADEQAFAHIARAA